MTTLRLHDEPTEGEKRQQQEREESRFSDTPPTPKTPRPDAPAQPAQSVAQAELADILQGGPVEPAKSQLAAGATDVAGVTDDDSAAETQLEAESLNYGFHQGHDPKGDNWGHGAGYGDEPIPAIEEAAVDQTSLDDADKMYRDADQGSQAGDGSADFEDALVEEDADLLADAETQDKQREGPGPVSELLAKLKGGDKPKDDRQLPPPPAPEEPGDGTESQAAEQDADGLPDQLEAAKPDQAQLDADGDGTPDMVDPTPEGQRPRPKPRELNLDDVSGRTNAKGGLDVADLNTQSALRAEQQENRKLRRQLDRQANAQLIPAKPPPQPVRRGGRGGAEKRGLLRGFRRR